MYFYTLWNCLKSATRRCFKNAATNGMEFLEERNGGISEDLWMVLQNKLVFLYFYIANKPFNFINILDFAQISFNKES